MRHPVPALLAALALAGCVTTTAPPPGAVTPAEQPRAATAAPAAQFQTVIARIEPVAERMCRSLRRGAVSCDITIVMDSNANLPPNAFQTLDSRGRPYVVVTRALLSMVRNADELAFVIGHEAAHHVAGHLPRRADNAMAGAILAGVLATASGLSGEDARAAQDFGATMGAQRYSQEFELEADALGAEIALRAGFDPVRGAAFFDRLPDPGGRRLSSHPSNAMRKKVVAQTVARFKDG